MQAARLGRPGAVHPRALRMIDLYPRQAADFFWLMLIMGFVTNGGAAEPVHGDHRGGTCDAADYGARGDGPGPSLHISTCTRQSHRRSLAYRQTGPHFHLIASPGSNNMYL